MQFVPGLRGRNTANKRYHAEMDQYLISISACNLFFWENSGCKLLTIRERTSQVQIEGERWGEGEREREREGEREGEREKERERDTLLIDDVDGSALHWKCQTRT